MMKYFSKYALTGLLFLTAFSACKKEYETIETLDDKNVAAYIQANNLNMQEYINLEGVKTGIYYQILNPGTGAIVNYTDKAFMTYTIKSLDGAYSSMDENVNRYGSYLGYLDRIHGFPEWSSVLKEKLMNRGGSIRLVIPSRLAYGRSGKGTIPGNACLDCTINLSPFDNITQFEDVFVKKYITDNNLTMLEYKNSGGVKTGLYYQIITPGAGETITLSSTINAVYSGKLTNGTVFDSNTSANPLSISLSSVISGWQQGVPLIKEGGKIRLIIPPALGYGPAGSGAVPGNSTLDFTIELIKK